MRVGSETEYSLHTVTKFYAAYFFLSDSYYKHSRDVMNIVDVLSKFGGLYAVILNLFAAIGFLANNRLLFAKFIRTLYFIRSKSEKDENKILI
jgi:hypothetical protein